MLQILGTAYNHTLLRNHKQVLRDYMYAIRSSFLVLPVQEHVSVGSNMGLKLRRRDPAN